jgi:hypothetical protein
MQFMLKRDLLVQFIPVALVAAVAAVLLVAPAVAAKGGGKGSNSSSATVAPLSLASENVSLNPKNPSWCVSEDDFDQRVFTGSLNGSYSTSYQLCGLDTDGYTAGGEGLTARVAVVGSLSDMAITAPDGTLTHAVEMSQSTSKGITTTEYAVCVVPPFYLATDTGTSPLEGGTWRLTLSGQITSATWTTTVTMAYVSWQQAYCPASEQNLISS